MYRRYYLVEVVLLLLLSHGGWNGPSVTLLSCTSESSKLVRDVVQKRFLSVVERYRVSLPLECPLHPRRDMFGWLQTELEATKVEGEETWNCPVCGQRFRCENTFVTHWDAWHSRRLGMAEETVCLDDFCDVFRCDVQKRKALRKKMQEDKDGLKKRQPPTYQGISLFRHAHQEVVEDDEIKQKKKNCDPKAMNQIHNKCRSLIRQCTIGMVANLSSKDFQDIEDDLDQSICSFLTCDKYWDDFDTQDHQVPMLVVVIFGLAVVSLFGFCYYGLWMLLERTTVNSSHVCCNCQKPPPIESYYRQKPQKNRHRQKSPEYPSRKNSPEFPSRQNSAEYSSRENSPEYSSRQNYPEYRQNSPEYDSRQRSPENVSTQTSHSSPEAITRQNCPEIENRQVSPENNSMPYPRECGSRQNSPEYPTRQNSPEYIGLHDYDEYHDARQNAREYPSRQNSPENEMIRRSPNFQLHLRPPQKDYDRNSSELYYRNRNRKNSPEKVVIENNKLQIPTQRAPSRRS